ncbi:hypothetical protein KAK06_16395 [Ideonella sp. 4Y11]|uniref:Uncharacterized protein n=1 Tax=Ideonella aquatica TaxID=2824119 RepID=A0A940YWJ1_9BURK|nr:hypothetical protein [Ideonella aquatica]MBQ0960535.1 hypothetical protein [Ideonella aquatica]
MTPLDLPSQYEPFTRVRIGSNMLENVKALATVGGNVPLLIGNGATPRVWLSIPADRTGSRWYPLVKDNFSSHPDVKVEAFPKRIVVRTPQGVVLSALRGNETVLNVQKLDLRPFGLNIYSDESALYVMGNTLAKNQFRNVSVVIGVETGA